MQQTQTQSYSVSYRHQSLSSFTNVCLHNHYSHSQHIKLVSNSPAKNQRGKDDDFILTRCRIASLESAVAHCYEGERVAKKNMKGQKSRARTMAVIITVVIIMEDGSFLFLFGRLNSTKKRREEGHREKQEVKVIIRFFISFDKDDRPSNEPNYTSYLCCFSSRFHSICFDKHRRNVGKSGGVFRWDSNSLFLSTWKLLLMRSCDFFCPKKRNNHNNKNKEVIVIIHH